MGGGGNFTMSGSASITNNIIATSGNGGGVYVFSGVFTMNGGTISCNNAPGDGGGVFVSNYPGSTMFTLTQGTVYGTNAPAPLPNTATGDGDAIYIQEYSYYGGPPLSGGTSPICYENATVFISIP
jgi:hypothetical protein